jgi:hypothetical protein
MKKDKSVILYSGTGKSSKTFLARWFLPSCEKRSASVKSFLRKTLSILAYLSSQPVDRSGWR